MMAWQSISLWPGGNLSGRGKGKGQTLRHCPRGGAAAEGPKFEAGSDSLVSQETREFVPLVS